MNLSSVSTSPTASTKSLTLTLVPNSTWQYQQRITTLEGSPNDTELLSLIFTSTTGEYISIYTSATAAAQLTSPNVANRTTLSQTRTSYDSKGAAYYICSVILVYALAIVLLVISLARKKRKDQYQPANQRSNGDDYYVKAGQAPEEHHSNDSNRCSIKGFSFGHSLTSENLDNFIGGDGWTPLRSSVQSMKQVQRTNKITPCNKTTSFDSVLQGGCSQKYSNLRFYQPETNEEVLTLVQVLPNDTRRSPPPKTRDRAGSMVSPLTSDKRNRFGSKRSCLNKSYSTSSGKCRWSMGPDGNIWILQLPENISSPTENWYDQKQPSKTLCYKSEDTNHNSLSNGSANYFHAAMRPNNLNIIRPFSSETDDTCSDRLVRQVSIDCSLQPLWQYQEGHFPKNQSNGKVDISSMFEKYEMSPSMMNSRKQGNSKDLPRLHSRPSIHDGRSKVTQPADQNLKIHSNANGLVNTGSAMKRKNDSHCCFHDANRSLKSSKKQPFLHTDSSDMSLQKLIHVTSV